MRDLRILALGVLCAVPITWSATWAAETRTEVVNQALASLLLGTLPLVGVMLLWESRLNQDHSDVRYGANRRSYAAGSLLSACAMVVGFSLASSIVSILIYRGIGDPMLMGDLLATLPIAFAGALSLMAFLSCGRVWLGKAGLVATLVSCWLLGSTELPIAAAVPTGHMRHLIGVGAELPFPTWVSFVCLYAMTAVTIPLTLWRVPR